VAEKYGKFMLVDSSLPAHRMVNFLHGESRSRHGRRIAGIVPDRRSAFVEGRQIRSDVPGRNSCRLKSNQQVAGAASRCRSNAHLAKGFTL
jgi:hypothetical protein